MTQRRGDLNIEDSLICKKAEECVQYILYCYLADRKAVVRRADLNKCVIKEYSKSFRDIFAIVQRYMSDVYGFELIDLDDKGEKYGLRSKFEYDANLMGSASGQQSGPTTLSTQHVTSDGEQQLDEQVRFGMLITALSLIFMSENEMDADTFWDTMKKLGVNKNEKKHKYLGDVHKYFTSDLVKDGYLEYEQRKGIDPPSFRFKWGYRAKLEITKHSVLKFVCEVYGGKEVCKPDEWIAQFSDANKADEFAGERDTAAADNGAEANDQDVEMTISTRGGRHAQSQAAVAPSTSVDATQRLRQPSRNR